MSWLKIDDSMWSNPKWLTVSPAAKALWTWAASYSSDKLTDGALRPVDWQVVAVHVGVDDWQPLVAELQEQHFLDPGPNGTLVIHDYLKYNPSREQVLAERTENARRQAEWYAHKREQKAPPNAPPNGVSNTVSNRCPVPGPVPVPVNVDDVALPATMPIAEQRKRIALQDVGMTEAQAAEFAEKCTLPRIEGVIAHARASPCLQNPTGYIISMLRSGRAIPKPPLPGGNHGRDRPNQRGPGETRIMPAAAEVLRDASGNPVSLMAIAGLGP